MAKAEGRVLEFVGEESIDRKILETFPYEGPRQLVEYSTDEWSSVCPFSGLPDFGRLEISYVPQSRIVELKSLKYYLISYRNVGIYQEHATSVLFQDLVQLLEPKFLELKLIYKTRGGIDTTTTMSTKDQ